MGLSERKSKQKIAADPRNLGWSQDTNRFSFQHLQKFGWDPTQGLGSENNKGNAAHIKVIRKLDSSGIGTARALKEGAEVGGAGEGLNSLFARLKKAGESQEVTPAVTPEREETPVVVEDVVEAVGGGVPIVASTPRALINSSRHKYVRSKRLAASSPAAMAEILGIPVSSLPASPSPLSGSNTPVAGPSTLPPRSSTSTPQQPEVKEDSRSRSSTSDAEDVLDHTVFTTAPISVSEYFRRKMAQKKAEREGKAIPVFEGVGEGERYSEVAKGFEGKKIKFELEEEEGVADGDEVKVKQEEEEVEVGAEGAGLGSRGDPNKVKSEPVSEAEGEEVKVKKEKKSKKDKSEKKEKKEKKDKEKKKKEKGKAVVIEAPAAAASPALATVVDEGEKKSKKDKKEKKEKKRKREDEDASVSAGGVEKVKKRKRDGDVTVEGEVEGEKKSKKKSKK